MARGTSIVLAQGVKLTSGFQNYTKLLQNSHFLMNPLNTQSIRVVGKKPRFLACERIWM